MSILTIEEPLSIQFDYARDLTDTEKIIPINKNNDYIPLFAVMKDNFNDKFQNVIHGSRVILQEYVHILKSVPNLEKLQSNIFINEHIHHNIRYVTTERDRSILAKNKMYFDTTWFNRSFNEILKLVRSKYEENYVYYLYGTGFLANSNAIGNCLNVNYCLTIHKKAIPLYLLNFNNLNPSTSCVIRNIDSKYLKLYYKTGLNEKNGPFPHVSSYFKKYVKKECEENEIIMEEIPEFSRFFNKFTIPKAKSLSESKELLKNEAIKRLLCQT